MTPCVRSHRVDVFEARVEDAAADAEDGDEDLGEVAHEEAVDDAEAPERDVVPPSRGRVCHYVLIFI